MTIHHDKLAYGKLASMSEEISEEALLQMLQNASEEKLPANDTAATESAAKDIPESIKK